MCPSLFWLKFIYIYIFNPFFFYLKYIGPLSFFLHWLTIQPLKFYNIFVCFSFILKKDNSFFFHFAQLFPSSFGLFLLFIYFFGLFNLSREWTFFLKKVKLKEFLFSMCILFLGLLCLHSSSSFVQTKESHSLRLCLIFLFFYFIF